MKGYLFSKKKVMLDEKIEYVIWANGWEKKLQWIRYWNNGRFIDICERSIGSHQLSVRKSMIIKSVCFHSFCLSFSIYQQHIHTTFLCFILLLSIGIRWNCTMLSTQFDVKTACIYMYLNTRIWSFGILLKMSWNFFYYSIFS